MVKPVYGLYNRGVGGGRRYRECLQAGLRSESGSESEERRERWFFPGARAGRERLEFDRSVAPTYNSKVPVR